MPAVSNRADRYSLRGPHDESRSDSNAWRATTPASWCWPCPSRGVPEKMDTSTCGRNRRITRSTSARSVSRGQKRCVSSSVFEKPKSKARVKYWCAPSTPRADSSSSVRSRPSDSPSSDPMRFWPPSPRDSDR